MGMVITTVAAKKKILLARAGIQALPKISQMAFGDGGISVEGEVLEPAETQENLKHEILRKDIDGYEIISDTEIQYQCTLAENELNGSRLSEIALIDEEGEVLAIKNFSVKEKDAEWEMTFRIKDTM